MPQAEEPSESRMRENLMSGSMRGGWKRGRRALGTRRWEAAPRKAPDLGPATAPVAYSTHKGRDLNQRHCRKGGGKELYSVGDVCGFGGCDQGVQSGQRDGG